MPLLANRFDETAEILLPPNHGNGVQRIGFLSCPGDHLRNVLILDHIETVGQTHFFVSFLNPCDESIGLFCLVAAFDTTDIGKFCQPLVGSCAKFTHYMRQQHSHGKTVGNTVETAQRMAYSMDITDTATGEGTACIKRATLHANVIATDANCNGSDVLALMQKMRDTLFAVTQTNFIPEVRGF